MSEHLQYRNPIDQQLSKFVEGDQSFKSELVEVYSKYMIDIQREFIQLVDQKNLEGLALLHHKHKTTCHVLALGELYSVFEQVRNTLSSKSYDNRVISEFCTKVRSICNTTLAQLQEL